MGQKVTDGKAFNAAAPSGQVINDYDLFRIAGWNGCAIGAKDATQVDRTLAFEMDPAAIYSIKLPAGITPVVGSQLFWATQDATTFQRGDTNLALTGAAGQLPCAKCLTTKNAAGYAQVRVFNLA
jgi:hypothetical protein